MNESRILEIERRLNDLGYAVRDLAAKVNELLQQLPRAWGQPFDPGTGGAEPIFWAITDGTAHVATGTWPSLTPDTFTSDVYKNVSGSLTSVAAGATIYWWYLDAMSTTSGQLVPCVLNADGETYDAIIFSCTPVT